MVSVIIPCHNSEAFVKRAVESVLRQSFPNWELILVNNNSTDGTMDILRAYSASYPERIKVMEEMKPGAPAARNRGLKMARGEWIQFLDADDELLPEKIERQLRIGKAENATLVAGKTTVVTKAKGREERLEKELITRDPWVALAHSKLGITSSILFKKQVLLEVDGWDETLKSSQEYHLLFEILKKGASAVAYDTAPNTIIHKSDSSISLHSDKKKYAAIVDRRIGLRQEIKHYLQEHNMLSPERRKAIDSYIFDALMLHRKILPEYVSSKMKTLQLKVPVKSRVKDVLLGLFDQKQK